MEDVGLRVRTILVRRFVRLWLVAVAILIAVLLALSGQAVLRATAARGPVPAMPADRDAPVAVALPALAQKAAPAAPAQGATGTIALPPLPVLPAAVTAALSRDIGIVPARSFSIARVGAIDQARARQCLTAAIYYEAASESDAGQQAVAQVILNRVRHPAFPATVCGVVYQGSDRAGCQFSFACDGALSRAPSPGGWARAARAAGLALAGYVYAPVGLATHYHTYAVTPVWNRSLVMTAAVGAHFFHRWKGYWGTASAFRQIYAGGEPVPGPLLPATPLPEAGAPIAVAAVTSLPAVPVRYPISGATPAPAIDTLPPASPILDRWKDSGKPLP